MKLNHHSQLTFEDIEQYMQGVDLAALGTGQTLLEESHETRVERLGRVFRTVRPLLGILNTLPIPASWRAAITLLVNAIEAVIAPKNVPAEAQDFKAGRDLEE
jgi:hypothetical protein